METIPMASPAQNDKTLAGSEQKPLLRLIPLDDTVVFPNMGITLTIDVGDDERVVLVPRHDNEFLEVGTIAEVSERIRLPGGGHAVAISGEHRGLIGAAQTGPGGELRVEVDERQDEHPVDRRTRELEREYRAIVEEILELRGDDRRLRGRRVPRQDRGGEDARGGRGAGAQGAFSPRADGRADGRVEHDPHLPRLADRRPLEQALRGAPGPGGGA